MHKIWFVLIGFVSLAAVAAVAAPAALTISSQDRVLGKADAPITVVEYASMTCPHCARFQLVVFPDIKKDWIDTGKVKWVFRDFPLDAEALKAAMVARCASADRFYAFVDTFLTAQDQWAHVKNWQAGLTRLAQLGGMSPADVSACFENKVVQQGVVESRLVASKELGVDSTPTFFINGKKIAGEMDTAHFEKLLTEASAKS
jgi:protein-disulfide isomerase